MNEENANIEKMFDNQVSALYSGHAVEQVIRMAQNKDKPAAETVSVGTQSRKWSIVINNPLDHGMTREVIRAALAKFNPVYYCLADEVGESGTPHTHIFIFAASPIRFGTIRNRFPGAHAERCRGTARENRDYIAKIGRWADTKKAETSVPGSFEEFGTLPDPADENKNPRMQKLVGYILDGMSDEEIIRRDPGFAFQITKIDQLREMLLTSPFKNKIRQVEVIYLYGDTGTGKTKSVFQRYSEGEVGRITCYEGKNGIYFDEYHGQPVLLLEEFRSQIPVYLMLNILDIYPLTLPSRYYNRVACYSTVYITSNIPLEEQYKDVQRNEPETWKAFLRRINKVVEFRQDLPPKEVHFKKEVHFNA